MSDLIENPKDRFSNNAAHLMSVIWAVKISSFEPRREKTGFLHMRKQRR